MKCKVTCVLRGLQRWMDHKHESFSAVSRICFVKCFVAVSVGLNNEDDGGSAFSWCITPDWPPAPRYVELAPESGCCVMPHIADVDCKTPGQRHMCNLLNLFPRIVVTFAEVLVCVVEMLCFKWLQR